MTDDRDQPNDLEEQLRRHYETVGRVSSVQLTGRVAEALDRGPGRKLALRLPADRRVLVATLAGAAVLAVVALVAGPLLLGSPAPVGEPTPTPTSAPTPAWTAILPTLPAADPSTVLEGARTQVLGRMRNGGAWWAQGNAIFMAPSASSGRGESPSPGSDTQVPAIFVLDADHIWTVGLGPGSSQPYGGQGPDYDHLHAVVNRTNAGVWQAASVPGDYPDSMLSLSFVDDLHGFLMCSGGRSMATSTILRTDDGGATWGIVATVGWLPNAANLGGMFAASDASTLWAGAQGEAGGHGHPLLAMSRDGGKTWNQVNLPGMSVYPGGFDAWLDEAPVFLDPRTGFVVVDYPNGSGSGLAVFMTTDAGRTWTRQNVPSNAGSVDFVDSRHWVASTQMSSALSVTSDGGRTWQTTQPLDAGLAPWQGYWSKLVFFDMARGYGLFHPGFGDSPVYLYRTRDGGESWQLESSA